MIDREMSENCCKKGRERLEFSDLTSAEDYFTKAIEFFPSNESAYFYRGVAKCRLGEYESAIPDFSKSIELCLPSSKSASYSTRGYAKFESGDYEGAISDFLKSLESFSEDHLTHFYIGMARYKLGKLNEAVSDFDKAIEIFPNHYDSHIKRGDVKADLEQNEDALSDYTKASIICPQESEALQKRSAIKRRIGDIEGADSDLESSIINDSINKAVNQLSKDIDDDELYEQKSGCLGTFLFIFIPAGFVISLFLL